MFHVDCTFEDLRIIADSADGKVYDVEFHELFIGEHKTITITSPQLMYIINFNMNNSKPEGFEKIYESLKPLFVDWPNTIRPIL